MSTIQTALSDGFRAAARLRLLLPWYAFTLALGLLQTWPLWTAGDTALRNPLLGELAGGGVDALIDLVLDNPAGLATAGSWALAQLPLTLLAGLAYAFFAGGVLSVYTGTRSFLAGCRSFWWPFCGLGVLMFLMTLLLLAITVPVALAVGSVALIVALLALALLNLLGEYARAIGVLNDRRNPAVLLVQAGSFCARHLGGVLVLALLATLPYVLLAGGYALLARLLGASPLLVVVQQLVVFAALWIKALRLALAVRYVALTRSAG